MTNYLRNSEQSNSERLDQNVEQRERFVLVALLAETQASEVVDLE